MISFIPSEEGAETKESESGAVLLATVIKRNGAVVSCRVDPKTERYKGDNYYNESTENKCHDNTGSFWC